MCREFLSTLTSELVRLIVAIRVSDDTLPAFLLGPDLTLFVDDAGFLVIGGCVLPGTLRLISMCLIAISKDFFESVLPNPELSGDEDFKDK